MREETKRKIGRANTGKKHKKERGRRVVCLCLSKQPCFEKDCLCVQHYVLLKEWHKQIIRVMTKKVFK